MQTPFKTIEPPRTSDLQSPEDNAKYEEIEANNLKRFRGPRMNTIEEKTFEND